MIKVSHDPYNKSFTISRNDRELDDIDKENLITIQKVKEVITAIDILFNNPEKKITICGGCVAVEPMENKKELKFDPVIFRDNKVVQINTNTLNVIINGHEFKTKKLNDSYQYNGITYYTNVIDSYTIKYISR